MAEQFQVLVHRNDENVHLKLMGNFDNKAAGELVDIVNLHCRNVSRIFIHTDGLESINCCDDRNFHHRLFNRSGSRRPQLFSTGRFSEMFSPI